MKLNYLKVFASGLDTWSQLTATRHTTLDKRGNMIVDKERGKLMSEGIKYFYKDLEGWTEINRFGLQVNTEHLDLPNQPPVNLIKAINRATQPRGNGRKSTPIPTEDNNDNISNNSNYNTNLSSSNRASLYHTKGKQVTHNIHK